MDSRDGDGVARGARGSAQTQTWSDWLSMLDDDDEEGDQDYVPLPSLRPLRPLGVDSIAQHTRAREPHLDVNLDALDQWIALAEVRADGEEARPVSEREARSSPRKSPLRARPASRQGSPVKAVRSPSAARRMRRKRARPRRGASASAHSAGAKPARQEEGEEEEEVEDEDDEDEEEGLQGGDDEEDDEEEEDDDDEDDEEGEDGEAKEESDRSNEDGEDMRAPTRCARINKQQQQRERGRNALGDDFEAAVESRYPMLFDKRAAARNFLALLERSEHAPSDGGLQSSSVGPGAGLSAGTQAARKRRRLLVDRSADGAARGAGSINAIEFASESEEDDEYMPSGDDEDEDDDDDDAEGAAGGRGAEQPEDEEELAREAEELRRELEDELGQPGTLPARGAPRHAVFTVAQLVELDLQIQLHLQLLLQTRCLAATRELPRRLPPSEPLSKHQVLAELWRENSRVLAECDHHIATLLALREVKQRRGWPAERPAELAFAARTVAHRRAVYLQKGAAAAFAGAHTQRAAPSAPLAFNGLLNALASKLALWTARAHSVPSLFDLLNGHLFAPLAPLHPCYRKLRSISRSKLIFTSADDRLLRMAWTRFKDSVVTPRVWGCEFGPWWEGIRRRFLPAFSIAAIRSRVRTLRRTDRSFRWVSQQPEVRLTPEQEASLREGLSQHARYRGRIWAFIAATYLHGWEPCDVRDLVMAYRRLKRRGALSTAADDASALVQDSEVLEAADKLELSDSQDDGGASLVDDDDAQGSVSVATYDEDVEQGNGELVDPEAADDADCVEMD